MKTSLKCLVIVAALAFSACSEKVELPKTIGSADAATNVSSTTSVTSSNSTNVSSSTNAGSTTSVTSSNNSTSSCSQEYNGKRCEITCRSPRVAQCTKPAAVAEPTCMCSK